MINARLVRSPSGQLAALKVRGHSGYAPKGSDIVCAAVSALIKAVLEALEAWQVPVKIAKMERGEVDFSVGEAGADDARLVATGDILSLGLRAIEREYGKYLVVKVEELQ